MTVSKAEQLKAAKAERKEAKRAWAEGYRACVAATRAWGEADARVRAIEAEP